MTQDLPELRRSTRRTYLGWAVGGSLLVLAAVLIWAFVFIPRGEWGLTERQTNTGPTGQLANQRSGESVAAKNDAVVPQTSRTVGAGQNSPAAATQIEQSAAPLQLSRQQRAKIHSYFAIGKADRVDSADFSLSIGAAVPQQVQLQKLPAAVSSAMGGYRGDEYILVRNQLVIVDPNARRVVAVVPDAG